VVYKVDRLTRSLTDFARLVDIFDKHGVSFVSITQSFNTTTSMGRLTLNVLLSFAQYEREVGAERVRDKVAASKAKGMFMGGNIPLGYINKDKKLVIIPHEAERVQWMFQRYLELKSIGGLLEEMHRLNIRTKIVTLSSGKQRGGVLYGKGALAYLLKNRCYVGEILHKGKIYPAEHAPIIDREIFQAVQASLVSNTIDRKAKAKSPSFLLAGLIYDSVGNRMTPSHSRKKGVRYRYYVSQAILQSRKAKAGQVFRVPAPDIEGLIERFLRERCRHQQGDLRALVEGQIASITVKLDCISVELATSGESGVGREDASLTRQVVNLPWSKKPFRAEKGVDAQPAALSGPNGELPSALLTPSDPRTKEALLSALAKARHWLEQLMAGIGLAEIANREGCTERHLRAVIQLAFVSPRIVQAIRDDAAAVGLNATRLTLSLPQLWWEQEKLHLLAA
jgi:hypothetical protein